MPTTLTAPELRPAHQSARAQYTRTATHIIIGSAWQRRPTPDDAGCISGPHTPPMTLRDKVVVVVGVIGLLFVGGLLAWEGWV